MIYTHVLKLGGGAVRSPLDQLRGGADPAGLGRPGVSGTTEWPLPLRPGRHAREPEPSGYAEAAAAYVPPGRGSRGAFDAGASGSAAGSSSAATSTRCAGTPSAAKSAMAFAATREVSCHA